MKSIGRPGKLRREFVWLGKSAGRPRTHRGISQHLADRPGKAMPERKIRSRGRADGQDCGGGCRGRHRHHPRGTGGEADLPLLASPSTRGGATAPWRSKLGKWQGDARGSPVRGLGEPEPIHRAGVSATPPAPGICCIAVSEIIGRRLPHALQQSRRNSTATLLSVRTSRHHLFGMTILAQLASDDVLDSAYEWLCRRRRDYSANSDVWSFRRCWRHEKLQIKNELLSGNYRFSLLSA